MTKLFSSIFFILILSSCSKSLKYPSWYLNPPKNDEKYLYGTGEGSDPEEAKYAALSDAASRLRVSVGSKLESAMDQDSSGFSSSVSQKITSVVEKISFTDYTVLKSEKTSHSSIITLIGVDVDKMQNSYEKEINKLNEEMKTVSNLGNSNLEKRNNLSKALNISTDIEAKVRILEAVNPNYNSKPQMDEIKKLKDSFASINSSLKISVSSQNDDIKSLIQYGLNKAGIGASDEKSSQGSIKVNEKWITDFSMNTHFVKLVLNISLIDSNGVTILTNSIESSGSSVANLDMAKKMAISKMQSQIDSKGIMKFLGI
ncbi:LPP20 family lipoprotein [Candidatus Deianiraea vastatrix]|uniref:Lipoprotein LPP20-like domain-containing protein n=1 Tax=Candidatus Deianiraea vastatrix TaxID=2163644 RepID=A0A5B8XCM5_9RICK|nr:LPP20 family lipoprotein [Candidatus Deianiraea vastatrix]QED23119.1 hypothetical protein Deia_00312 [Candidatus Deianiraea vastatrix]